MPADLDMALDDMIDSSGKGKGKGRGKGKSYGKGRGWESNGSNGKRSSGPQLDMSLDEIVETSWSDEKGKGKSKGKGKDRDRDREDSWGSSYGKSYGKGKSSYKGDGYSSWGGKGKGKSFDGPPGPSPYWMEHDDRGDEEDWAPPRRAAPRYEEPWSKGREKGWGKAFSKGFGKGEREGIFTRSMLESRADSSGYAMGSSASSWRRVEEEPRRGRASALGAVADAVVNGRRAVAEKKRPRPRDDDSDEDPPPKKRAAPAKKSETKSIKVTNIPKELKAADIREAFEAETGKVTLCELRRGTADITFAKAKDAQKAVETFDRGELNGKIISVTLVD